MTEMNKSEEQDYRSAREAAVKYIGSNFSRSRAAIRHKLQRLGYESGLIEQVIVDLEDMDYLSDLRAARISVARHQGRRAKGDLFLKNLLYEQGIDRVAAEEVLSELPPEASRLMELLADLSSSLKDKGYQRAYRFLLGRGFSSDLVRRALEETFEEE